VRLPAAKRLEVNTLGITAEPDELEFCQITPEALAAAMRAVFDGGQRGVAARARAGAAVVRRRFTWSRSLGRLTAAIDALLARSTPAPVRARRRAVERERRVFATARALYLGVPAVAVSEPNGARARISAVTTPARPVV
jgi:hypothetical protein